MKEGIKGSQLFPTKTKESDRTVSGYNKYDVVSALIKSLRRGYEEDALFWAFELEGNAWYLWKRLQIFCSEDIGLANPEAIQQITSLRQAYFDIKDSGGGRLFIAQAVIYLCRSSKNRMIDYVVMEHFKKRANGWLLKVPDYAFDKHTLRGKREGRGIQFFLQNGALENNVVEVPPLVKSDKVDKEKIKLSMSSQKEIENYNNYDKASSNSNSPQA